MDNISTCTCETEDVMCETVNKPIVLKDETDSGNSMPDSGNSMPDSGNSMPDSGNSMAESEDDTSPSDPLPFMEVIVHRCDICFQTFEAEISYIKHLKTHLDHKYMFCNICKQIISSQEVKSLSLHLVICRSQYNSTHDYLCGLCHRNIVIPDSGDEIAYHQHRKMCIAEKKDEEQYCHYMNGILFFTQ